MGATVGELRVFPSLSDWLFSGDDRETPSVVDSGTADGVAIRTIKVRIDITAKPAA
jgi:hypothetical protein